MLQDSLINAGHAHVAKTVPMERDVTHHRILSLAALGPMAMKP